MEKMTLTELEITEIGHLDFDVPCAWIRHGVYSPDDQPARWIITTKQIHTCHRSHSGPICDPCLTFMMTTQKGMRCPCHQVMVTPYRDGIASVYPLNSKE